MIAKKLVRIWPYFVTIAATASGGVMLDLLGVANGLLIGGLLASLLACKIYPRASAVIGSLQYVQIVLGLELGVLFATGDPGISSGIIAAASFLALCLALQIIISFLWLRYFSGWTTTDALLASYPGAMAAVLDLFDKQSASPRVIMVHVLRLLILTIAASLLIKDVPSAIQAPAVSGQILLIIIGIAGVSLAIGICLQRCNVPAPYMLVATFVTAGAIGSGTAPSFNAPPIALSLCEVLLAILITIRFKETSFRELRVSIVPGVLAIALMLLTSAGVAWLASGLIGRDFATLALSYVPGGIESVAIIAISSGLEAAFIMKLHLGRLVVVQTAPAIVSLFKFRSSIE